MMDVPGQKFLSMATAAFLLLAAAVGSLALFLWSVVWLREAARAFVR
jgi:hypothetical protein